MPVFRCSHPSCTATLDRRGYCAQHAGDGQQVKAERHRHYDQHQRDPAAKAFYNSAAWKRTRAAVLAADPTCRRCGRLAEHVHHIIPLARCTPAQKLDPSNLLPTCQPCHNAIEAEAQGHETDRPHVSGMLDIVADDEFEFDADAAERPIRFIERYMQHYEGRFAGQPFMLEPVQKQIIRDVYGWKERATGYRRFSQVWFEAAAGAGKSPLLAALGLYGLMADNEPGAQVYSVASNFSQARVVFDCAKRFIEASPELAARLKVTQYEISHRKSKSFWRVISGKGNKAGLRPSLVLADEIHEWPSREVYDSLQGRMTKRTQPLYWCATNAGESRQSLCWQLHEEAVAVLDGRGTNRKLYPIIWAAPKEAKLDDPGAWKLANPLLGVTVAEQKVRDECERAKGSPVFEARFRRLYLSQWVQGSTRWLDMARWDSCAGAIDPVQLREHPLYVGLDLSQGDDLCAAVFVWVSRERFYVRSKFWVPRDTAEHYQTKEAYPYREWAEQGHITLLDEVTVNPAVLERIADEILDATKGHQLKAVCYDRYKADHAVKRLEASGVTCMPIAQGFTVTPGCQELDRRLKEQSITIAPNPVLRACAEVVEVKHDDRGNFWPTKPNAKGSYAGTRSQKIDGISSLVTALTEARRHDFPAAAPKDWQGSVIIL